MNGSSEAESQAGSNHRGRLILGRLLLVGLTLVLGEAFLRLVFPQPEICHWNRIDYTPVGIFGGVEKSAREGPGAEDWQYAPRKPMRNVTITWHSEPDGIASDIHLNLYGFRGPDFELAPRPGSQRVLFLGDSMVEGYGADEAEAIPRVFETLAGDGVEAINLGVGGTNPRDFVQVARIAIPMLKPDVVVLILSWNDLPMPAEGSGAPSRNPERCSRWTPRAWTLVRAAASGERAALFVQRGPYSFFRPVPDPSNPFTAFPETGAPVAFRSSTTDPDILDAMRRGRFNPWMRDLGIEKALLQRLPSTADASREVLEISGLAERNGARLIVSYVPVHVTISDAYLEPWRQLGESFESPSLVGETFRPHQRRLSTYLGSTGIPFVDPSDAFEREERSGRRLYLAYDGHLNADGYALLAELLVQEFRRGS